MLAFVSAYLLTTFVMLGTMYGFCPISRLAQISRKVFSQLAFDCNSHKFLDSLIDDAVKEGLRLSISSIIFVTIALICNSSFFFMGKFSKPCISTRRIIGRWVFVLCRHSFIALSETPENIRYSGQAGITEVDSALLNTSFTTLSNAASTFTEVSVWKLSSKYSIFLTLNLRAYFCNRTFDLQASSLNQAYLP